MENSIVNTIVAADMCCGCGTCAGVCPSNSLTMIFDRFGKYQPQLDSDCSNCGMCLEVCPFNRHTENELSKELFQSVPDIKTDNILGYYHTCLMGFAKRDGLREKGASGGMVSLLLTVLFEKNEIDGAVVVGPSECHGVRFESKVVRSIEDIQRNTKSKYYPVEHSRALEEIQQHEGRYAVVGLPCHIYGIRKAQKQNKILRERIKYLFGLVCGHGVTTQFTEFLIDCAEVQRQQIIDIDYRDKFGSKRASNYAFRVSLQEEGIKQVKLPFQESVLGDVWKKRMFVPNACDFCDDAFAELADVTFMDAWLKQPMEDPKGTSIIVGRNPVLSKYLLEACLSNQCQLVEVEAQTVIRSQLGVVQYKCYQIAGRIAYAKKRKQWVPERRIRSNMPSSWMERMAIKLNRWNKWISSRVYHSSFLRRIFGANLVYLCFPVDETVLRNLLQKLINLPRRFLKN